MQTKTINAIVKKYVKNYVRVYSELNKSGVRKVKFYNINANVSDINNAIANINSELLQFNLTVKLHVYSKYCTLVRNNYEIYSIVYEI